MKKLVPVIFISLLLGSCEKEYCWHCEIYSKVDKLMVISTSEYCDKTEKEIMKIEKQHDGTLYAQKCVRYMK